MKRLLTSIALLPSGLRAAAGEKDLKQRLLRLTKHSALLLVVLAVGGMLLAASGIIPIKASSRHWALTDWFLSFSMQRSVATHSLGIKTPSLQSLDDPSLVLKGAGHYESGCSPCHGSPQLRQPRVPAAMTPPPPYLSPKISHWEPKELFFIVKHGVKFTGMPAWPTRHRDDEVWAMVAFLRALPGLDAAAYRKLVSANLAPSGDVPQHGLPRREDVPEAVTESCGRCHGADGRGRGEGAFPRLAGQRPTYLYAALQAYARGARHSGMMEPVAARLSRQEMRALAHYYGNLQAAAPAGSVADDAAAIERGKAIAHRGIPSKGIPSCSDCHGPSPTPKNPHYPLLAGQYARYLVLQLELFQKQQRGGSAYAHLMRTTAHRLTREQMYDVALYYAALPLTAGN